MKTALRTYSLNGLYRSMDIWRDYIQYPSEIRLQGIRYLYQYRNNERIAPSVDEINRRLEKYFDDFKEKTDPEYQTALLEIADIAMEYFPERGRRMLEFLRRRDGVPLPFRHLVRADDGELREDRGVHKKRTVYTDSQNVHNSTINCTVKDVAQRLVADFPFLKTIVSPLDYIQKEIYPTLNVNDNRILKVLEHIHYDVANFSIGVRVEDVLFSIWYWIQNGAKEEWKPELIKRLVEELNSMRGYCSSGHLSRLINVIQGFAPEEYSIRISNTDQCKSVVRAYITKMLQECKDDNVHDAMISKNKEPYIKYVYEVVEENIPAWLDEYGLDFVYNVEQQVCSFLEI